MYIFLSIVYKLLNSEMSTVTKLCDWLSWASCISTIPRALAKQYVLFLPIYQKQQQQQKKIPQ